MRTELLLPTFGGHASVQVSSPDDGAPGNVMVYDTCCDGGEAHHDHPHGAEGSPEAPAPADATESRSDR